MELKAKRKSIGNSKRFKVFERDNYSCRYCGKKPPEVTLEVDHFIPVKESGGNDFENLLTSCRQCNQGKKARISRSPHEKNEFQSMIEEKKDVIKQMKEMNKYNEKIRNDLEQKITYLSLYWEEIHDGRCSLTTRGSVSLKTFLKKFSVNEIMEAMEIALVQCRQTDDFKYMCGILRNWEKDRNLELKQNHHE